MQLHSLIRVHSQKPWDLSLTNHQDRPFTQHTVSTLYLLPSVGTRELHGTWYPTPWELLLATGHITELLM